MEGDIGEGVFLSKKDGDRFGSLQVVPSYVSIDTQDDDEIIYILTRKDIVTNSGWIFLSSLLLLIPIFLLLVIPNLFPALKTLLPFIYFAFLIAVYYTVIIAYCIYHFNKWYYNFFIVTNKRILKYTYSPFSTYDVSEANLQNIQDVSEMTIGVIPSFFDYGNLMIQTAGTKNKFEIESIPKPTWLRNVLVDLARTSKNPEP